MNRPGVRKASHLAWFLKIQPPKCELSALSKRPLRGQPCNVIKSPPTKDRETERLPEKGNPGSTRWDYSQHKPGSSFFPCAPVPSKARLSLAEPGVWSFEPWKREVYQRDFSASLCSGILAVARLCKPASLMQTNVGGHTLSSCLLTHAHCTHCTYTYVPFALHCGRPGTVSSHQTACTQELALLSGFSQQPRKGP